MDSLKSCALRELLSIEWKQEIGIKIAIMVPSFLLAFGRLLMVSLAVLDRRI